MKKLRYPSSALQGFGYGHRGRLRPGIDLKDRGNERGVKQQTQE
jgi:hypothetical protein